MSFVPFTYWIRSVYVMLATFLFVIMFLVCKEPGCLSTFVLCVYTLVISSKDIVCRGFFFYRHSNSLVGGHKICSDFRVHQGVCRNGSPPTDDTEQRHGVQSIRKGLLVTPHYFYVPPQNRLPGPVNIITNSRKFYKRP